MNNIDIIGANTPYGQPKLGVDLGPDAVRYAGLLEALERLNFNVNDKGNIRPQSLVDVQSHSKDKQNNLKNFEAVKNFSNQLAKCVDDSVSKGNFPLIIGGDHSLSIGSIAGLASHYNNLGVIWFDAHGDINDSRTSPSGNIHGMPLAISLGLGHEALVNTHFDGAKVKKENIVLIGVRDLDDGEINYIKQENIKTFTSTDVRAIGIKKVIEESIEYLKLRTDHIHLSLDVDALDPIYTPGTGTPVKGGVSLSDTQVAVNALHKSGLLVSMDLVEVNPLLDEKNKTAELAVELASYALGKKQL